MFKKLLLTSAVLAATSSIAFANAAPYVGVSLGGGGYHSNSGVIGNIFAGYGSTLGAGDWFYLAGELNGSMAHYGHHSYNSVYGYGMSIIPGIMVTQRFMIYGRAGLNANYPYHNFKYGNYDSHLGLGIQGNVSRNWDVRAEYTHLSTPNSGSYNLGLVYKFI